MQHATSRRTCYRQVRWTLSVINLWPLLFAVYCSPVVDITAHHGVQYHQYTDDTQLHLAMCADNTSAELSVLVECTTDAQWYLQNGLQLNQTSQKLWSSERPITCVRWRRPCRLCPWQELMCQYRRYEGAGSRARSTSDVAQGRLDGGTIVQLPRTGHLTHPAPADYGTCTDSGL